MSSYSPAEDVMMLPHYLIEFLSQYQHRMSLTSHAVLDKQGTARSITVKVQLQTMVLIILWWCSKIIFFNLRVTQAYLQFSGQTNYLPMPGCLFVKFIVIMSYCHVTKSPGFKSQGCRFCRIKK